MAAAKGGVYASHMRNEGDAEFDALNEAFRIGREANIPVQIFHLKVAGKQNWGNMPKVIAAIEAARASGLDVTANQYPYVAGGTSLGASIPPKYHEGGTDAFVTRLKDPATRAQIRADLQSKGTGFENMWRSAGGTGDGILVASVLNPDLKQVRRQDRRANRARWRTKTRWTQPSTSSSPTATTWAPCTSA